MTLPPLPWEDLGAGALVSLIVILVLIGWLIPKRTYDREIKGKNDEIANLRRANIAKDEANIELIRQNSSLLEAAKTGTAIAESVQRLLYQEFTE